MVKLDIFSDPICPWCFIGKTRLDQALAEVPDHPFTIEWHPFQLNPDMPADGMDRRDYLEGKFGGKERAAAAYAPVMEHAEKLGLNIDFAAMQRTPNTVNAHRLIHWAAVEGVQTAVVSSLFAAYFCQGRDIGQADVLADVAAKSGMDVDMVLRLLATDEDKALIMDLDQNARAKGVRAVPTFVVANQHVIPGAQTAAFWTDVIQEVKEALEKT